MRKKKFKKLKDRMYEKEITQQELREELNRSGTYLTRRLTGRDSFPIDEVYQICDLLEIPDFEIPIYFPRDDLQAKNKLI